MSWAQTAHYHRHVPGLRTSEPGPVPMTAPTGRVRVQRGCCLSGREVRPQPPSAPRLAQPRLHPRLWPTHSSRAPHQSASFSPRPRPHMPLPRPQGSIYINDYARVVSSDQQAVNGILHFIDRVLLPPDALHWEPDAAPIPRV